MVFILTLYSENKPPRWYLFSLYIVKINHHDGIYSPSMLQHIVVHLADLLCDAGKIPDATATGSKCHYGYHDF
jgi:hypothetical protein